MFSLRATIADPSNNARLGAPRTIPPSYIRVRTAVWECGEGQTQRPTRLMRNVSKRRQFNVKWKRVRNRKLLFHLRFANMFLSLMNIMLVLFRNGLCLFFSHVNHASELIMAALWNKAGHYILALWFLLLSSFFLFFLA